MATYQPAAGPSRSYGYGMPAAAPLVYTPPTPQEGEWANGSPGGSGAHGMGMPEPMIGRANSVSDDGRRNPLVDLIDTERVYVDQLGLVIRRVAGAWSRKDFPPPKLDAMFRCVEAVYRANRAFGTKLKEIGPNPSSPKALGDLLMRWIDDLEPAYHRYSVTYMSGFDSFPPVTNNVLLPGILTDISATCPPTPPLVHWSLDALFLLPFTRLRYYRKLYARLLRSTKEGRSDHRLLVGANQKLDSLVAAVEGRLEVDVTEEEGGGSEQPSRAQSWANEKERISRTSSAMDSSIESHTGYVAVRRAALNDSFSPFNSRVEDSRNSGGSVATSMTQSPQRRPIITTSSAPPVSPAPGSTTPLVDLELRIDTERALDLFTMQPKKCKLQMNPATLSFTRFLRSSHDVTIYFNPTSTGQSVVHRRAHVFVLADLFLVADRMEASDKAAKAQQVAREQPERVGEGGPMPEMWLAYPPLAGKHLAVAEGQQANVLTVTVMRKETFVIHAESEMERDQIVKDLIDCIDFAASVSRKNTSAQPSPDPRSPTLSETRSIESTFPPLRYPSPFSPASSPGASPRPSDVSAFPPPPVPLHGQALEQQMGKLALEPGDTVHWPRGPSPPPKPPVPGLGPPPALQPGLAALPPRGASLKARQPSLPAGMPVPPPHGAPFGGMPHATSEPFLPGAPLPRSASGRSLGSQRPPLGADGPLPPVPQIRTGPPPSNLSDSGHSYSMPHLPPARSRSAEPLRPVEPPSARFSSFPGGGGPGAPGAADPDSPPMSPVEEEATTLSGPSTISAQMKCKVFLQQGHGQWKSLGGGKLKLYVEQGRNVKQLVVESDGGKTLLISTIVLTDGVERVAKTGVAVEISDRGHRTGIIYMIQLRNETSAVGLFESLLAGSDRMAGR